MCLSTCEPITNPAETSGFGWKVFYLGPQHYGNNQYYSEGWLVNGRMPDNVWLKAEITTIGMSKGGSYQSGYHIFVRIEDAEAWCLGRHATHGVRKVEYRNAHTRGLQKDWERDVDAKKWIEAGKYEVIIAHEMRILPSQV